MISQIINFLRAWLRGDEAELNAEFHFVITWLDIAITAVLIALIVWLWR